MKYPNSSSRQISGEKAPICIFAVENDKIRHFTPDPNFDLEKNRKMV
jgi:hypothetical protein